MSDEESRELIARGVEAGKAGRRDEARRLIARALDGEPSVRDMIRAWQYLSEISDGPDERRAWLEKMLAADPSDGYARRELSILNGEMSRDEVIAPDAPKVPASASIRQESSRAFACPQCGSGRMVADPAAGDLVCQYCGHREASGPQHPRGERDVTAALWTAKGRSLPRSVTVFQCTGCGASFLAAPDVLSANCPYCSTVYVVGDGAHRDLIEPDGIVPFVISPEEAKQALEDTGVVRPVPDVHGVYLPAWLFTFSGEVDWKGTQRAPYALGSDRREAVSGVYTIVEVSACTPAGSQSPDQFRSAMVDAFDWKCLVPYQTRLLANWPAETYQVNLETASLAARGAVAPALRAEVLDSLESGIEDLEMSFVRVAANSFRLVLCPLWIARIERAGDRQPVFVNGQSGAAYVPKASGVRGWLSKWF